MECQNATLQLSHLQVEDDGSKPVDRNQYQSILGSLLYVSIATGPDISFSVGVLPKFNAASTKTHLTAAKRVLRYLKGTMDYGLIFCKSGEQLVGYSDANWAENDENPHSISSNVFMANKGPISWLSK